MPTRDGIDGFARRTRTAWNHPSWWNLLVALPWAIGLVLMVHESRTDSQIAGRQQTAPGFVTAYEPTNRNQYGYKFDVGGKTYTGLQSPQHNELALGKEVVVYYDPQDPSRNALTDFHDLSSASLGPIPFLVLGIGAVATIIFYRRSRGSAAPNSCPPGN